MQISRHWRMKAQRYRLEGVRYANGEVSLQDRPTQIVDENQTDATVEEKVEKAKAVA